MLSKKFVQCYYSIFFQMKLIFKGRCDTMEGDFGFAQKFV